jgi:hypothetical protein
MIRADVRNVCHSSGQIFQNNFLRSDNNPYLADGVAGKRSRPLPVPNGTNLSYADLINVAQVVIITLRCRME